MPEVTIQISAGHPADAKLRLMKDVTDAVVRNLRSNPDHVVVSIQEVPREDKARGGRLLAETERGPK